MTPARENARYGSERQHELLKARWNWRCGSRCRAVLCDGLVRDGRRDDDDRRPTTWAGVNVRLRHHGRVQKRREQVAANEDRRATEDLPDKIPGHVP